MVVGLLKTSWVHSRVAPEPWDGSARVAARTAARDLHWQTQPAAK